MRIFIAGASGDREKIGELIQALPSFGCTGYDWTTNLGYEDPVNHSTVGAAGASVREINIADALILHVSEKPSPGATGEAITAFLAGIPIVVLVDAPVVVTVPESGPCLCSYSADTPLRNRIPPENIWAHWLAIQCVCVETFEDAMREILGAEAVA